MDAISLQPITQQNYDDVCDLDVTVEQEKYVACNMYSLVESFFNEGYETRAIYCNGEAVGFFMWVHETQGKVSIWRFMVDKKHQCKGIGRQAMLLALEEIRLASGLREIEICYHPENPVAKSFYSSFGFKEIGMDEDGEDMIAVISL